MPTAEYMREYRKRPGVRERELRNKREYDLWHREANRARWRRRNAERKTAKAAWYRRSAERIAKDRKTRRDYVTRFGRVPKRYIFTIADMRKALDTGNDPFASLRAAWKAGAKRGAKQRAATRKQRKAHKAIWAAYQKMFPRKGGFWGWYSDALIRKSLKTGRDYMKEAQEAQGKANEKAAAEWRQFQAEKAAQPLPAFTAKNEAVYTRTIKNRKLFEGACDLRWQEYFEFRDANKCDRLSANDLRYAGQYTVCPAPKR
jgi:hypothetical protein